MTQHTALITGASSGLGVAFARNLAARGNDLVLTARSRDPMDTLAEELRQKHGVAVSVQPVDLGRPDGPGLLARQLEEQGLVPDLLVSNAGFGISERFTDHDPARLAEMLQLNVVTPTELARTFGHAMAVRGRGHILMVASLAAFQPTPLLSAYGATKAYILSLGEALNVELGAGVGVTVLSPGLMDTGFANASGFKIPPALKRTILSTEAVTEIGLDALFAGRSSVVAGRMNRLMAFSARFLSRHAAARQSYRMSGGV